MFSLPRRLSLAALGLLILAGPAAAERVKNPIAVFNGLDKISGKILPFDVAIGETVQFGALQVTPRVCYSRSASEAPQTTSFLEVDEVTLDKKVRRIFTGWMFAASPGLHALEHPVYDIWLTDCKGGVTTDVPVATPAPVETKPPKTKPGKPTTPPADQTPDDGLPPSDPNAPVD